MMKDIFDWGAFAGIMGYLTKIIIEPLSALIGMVWLGIRLWETDTVRKWTGRPRKEKNGDE